MLASRKAYTLGVVFYEFEYMTMVSFGGVLGGFAKTVSYAGYNLHFCCSSRESPIAQKQHFLENARAGMVDGVLVMDSLVANADILALDELNVPFVLIDREIPGREKQSIWNDQFGSGFLIARHLISEGYRRTALLYSSAGPEALPQSKLRREGFMQGSGGAAPLEILIDNSPKATFANQIVDLLRSQDRPDAIVCWAAQDAVRLLCTAVGLGIRVPEDLGIAAFEDDPVLHASQPEITAARFHWDIAGEIAGRVLLGLLEGEEPAAPMRPLPVSLVPRGSSVRSAGRTPGGARGPIVLGRLDSEAGIPTRLAEEGNDVRPSGHRTHSMK